MWKRALYLGNQLTHFGADSLTLMSTMIQGKLKQSKYLKALQKRTGRGGQREALQY